jgi:hypothetical protein
MNEPKTQPRGRYLIDSAVDVIARPAVFFQRMSRSGGLLDPLMFLLMIGVLTGLVNLALSPLLLDEPFVVALGSIVMIPVMLAVLGFVVAGALFLIWRLMGSRESFETSYRCVAYAAAILPITVVLGGIPYLGTFIVVMWWMLLLVVASVRVHGLRQPLAVAVFGAIGMLLVLMGLTVEYTALESADVAAWRAPDALQRAAETRIGSLEAHLRAEITALRTSGGVFLEETPCRAGA